MITPKRIAKLPKDHRGFPVPWFAAKMPDGTYDFRVADQFKKGRAVRHNLCWVCGEPLGQYKAFTIGPMCVVNRNTAEPPAHLECAHFSVHNCPFLSRPRMRRNDKGLDEIGAVDPPGYMITRNPGVTCIWVCKKYSTYRVHVGGDFMIRLGDPIAVEWWKEGRAATVDEVKSSIDSGLPSLRQMAVAEGSKAIEQFEKQLVDAQKYLPTGHVTVGA